MTDLIDTTEMYLRTILELEEENIVPLRARISERLGHSGPTVSQTVGRMERDGLVVVSDDRRLELTGSGRQKAVDVMREQVELRLVELLGHPTESPYGNPIPGLDQLGDAAANTFDQGVVGLVRILNETGGPVQGTVRRLAEPAQVDPELLKQFMSAGVVPGGTGDFRFSEGYVLVQMDGVDEALELPVEVAAHVFLVDARG